MVAVRGEMELRAEVRPRFDYARHAAAVRRPTNGDAIEFVYEDVCLRLRATVGLQAGEDHATATFSLAEGAAAAFILDFGGSGHSDASVLDPHGAVTSFEQTVRFWRDWLAQGSYRGRWREMGQRSALTLKLLTHRPSGAILAAPTASLPEHIGGERNWDYRFVWSRDAAFSAYALLSLGYLKEAGAFVGWLTDPLQAVVHHRPGEHPAVCSRTITHLRSISATLLPISSRRTSPSSPLIPTATIPIASFCGEIVFPPQPDRRDPGARRRRGLCKPKPGV